MTMRRRRRRHAEVEEKGSRIRVQAEEEEEEEARRRICRPRTCHPVGFGGSWAFLVPWWKPNRGFEVQNPAGALRTPTPTVLSTHLEQGRNAHRDAQAKNALTSIPPPPPSIYTPRPPGRRTAYSPTHTSRSNSRQPSLRTRTHVRGPHTAHRLLPPGLPVPILPPRAESRSNAVRENVTSFHSGNERCSNNTTNPSVFFRLNFFLSCRAGKSHHLTPLNVLNWNLHFSNVLSDMT